MRRLLVLLILCASCFGTTWPGQVGNSVGYQAYGSGVLGTAACGSPTSGTNWSTATTISSCKYTSTQTVSCNYCIFSQVDFQNGAWFNGSSANVLVVGSRFQSNAIEGGNLAISGSNIYLLYDSITPLTSFATSPPGYSVWPAAGAGTNVNIQCTTGQTTGGCSGTQNNALDGLQGYEYGINLAGLSGAVYIDHCDIWGFGDALILPSGTTAQITITNNWMHDAANSSWSSTNYSVTGFTGTSGTLTFNATNSFSSGEAAYLTGFTAPNTGLNNQNPYIASPTGTTFQAGVSGSGYSSGTGTAIANAGYHTDGPGYSNGAAGPSNVSMIGNTVALLGNTNALALQAASSGYAGIYVNNNYWTGDSITIAYCQPGTTRCTNSTFYGNTLGTDLMNGASVYSAGSALGTGTVWACNTIAFASGTTWTNSEPWTPTSGMNGQYFLNASPPNSATDQGSNTICGIPSPSSINFGNQGVSSSSAGTTITFSNTNSGTISSLSASLATGTQFSISANTCGSTLAASASCSITVKFTPTGYGPQTDTLQIADNSSGVSSPQLVPLIGVGVTNTGVPVSNSSFMGVIR